MSANPVTSVLDDYARRERRRQRREAEARRRARIEAEALVKAMRAAWDDMTRLCATEGEAKRGAWDFLTGWTAEAATRAGLPKPTFDFPEELPR